MEQYLRDIYNELVDIKNILRRNVIASVNLDVNDKKFIIPDWEPRELEFLKNKEKPKKGRPRKNADSKQK